MVALQTFWFVEHQHREGGARAAAVGLQAEGVCSEPPAPTLHPLSCCGTGRALRGLQEARLPASVCLGKALSGSQSICLCLCAERLGPQSFVLCTLGTNNLSRRAAGLILHRLPEQRPAGIWQLPPFSHFSLLKQQVSL